MAGDKPTGIVSPEAEDKDSNTNIGSPGGFMAYEYDRVERENGGGAFLMGMLAGTVLGAGLGMLFAPKAGSEVRKQLSEQANRLRSTANDTLQQASDKISQASHQASERIGQASEKVSQIVDRGREAYDRAKAPVSETIATGYPTTAPSDRH
jgi:gas vesicle protein